MRHVYEEPTYAVFGDVHAHFLPLMNALTYIGWDKDTLKIPHNLTIIQLGDLIHKGPYTNEIIAFVDSIMNANNDDPQSGSWVQLAGNHESQYLDGPVAFWRAECNVHSIDTLNRWWNTGRMKLHYVIEQDSGKPYVVTHAGVNPFWYYRSELFFKSGAQGIALFEEDYQEFKAKQTMENFSAWLDELRKAPAVACIPGSMLTGKFNYQAGPVWAETVREVYTPWRDEIIPFHQIHGHVTPFSWTVRKFFPLTPEAVKKELILFRKKRRSLWVNSDGSEFYGVDNGFDHRADLERLRPLMLSSKGVLESDKDIAYFVNHRGKLEKTQP
jgi:hypothetical protein